MGPYPTTEARKWNENSICPFQNIIRCEPTTPHLMCDVGLIFSPLLKWNKFPFLLIFNTQLDARSTRLPELLGKLLLFWIFFPMHACMHAYANAPIIFHSQRVSKNFVVYACTYLDVSTTYGRPCFKSLDDQRPGKKMTNEHLVTSVVRGRKKRENGNEQTFEVFKME